MSSRQVAVTLCLLWLCGLPGRGQRFSLFTPEVKRECPSVVYDFLERYLYEMDSLLLRKVDVVQRLQDDRVVFLVGTPATARQLHPSMFFTLSRTDHRYYEVCWQDTVGTPVLSLAFPMQYELLLGKPKVEIERTFRETLCEPRLYTATLLRPDTLLAAPDGCLTTYPASHYHVESLNTAVYLQRDSLGRYMPTFSDADPHHSAANLFQGYIDSIGGYTLCVEQQLYGFRKQHYSLPLSQWLAYCQAMGLTLYFAVEEESEEGLRALLVAQSNDLGFNHMLSIFLPKGFVQQRRALIQTTLNAYIPTQNVKELYQQYIDKPKKKI